MKKLMTILVLHLSLYASSVPQNIDLAKEALKEAHQNFILKKYKKMSLNLKEVFTFSNGNKEIEDNAYKLLNNAFKVREGKKIPTDWKKPEDFKYIKVTFRKEANPGSGLSRFRINLSGEFKNNIELDQIKVTQYPNKVLLNKEKGKGYFEYWIKDNERYGLYMGRVITQANTSGLFYIDIKVKDHELQRHWVIVNPASFSKLPKVTYPQDADVIEGSFTGKWKNFVSSDYQDFERRKLHVKIKELRGENRKTPWRFFENNPIRSTLHLSEGEFKEPLKPGLYLYSVDYSERRKFGDFKIGRDYRTVIGFKYSGPLLSN